MKIGIFTIIGRGPGASGQRFPPYPVQRGTPYFCGLQP